MKYNTVGYKSKRNQVINAVYTTGSVEEQKGQPYQDSKSNPSSMTAASKHLRMVKPAQEILGSQSEWKR